MQGTELLSIAISQAFIQSSSINNIKFSNIFFS